MIGFTPQFIHQDWVDGVDTVQAADDNVFNGRFHALESEFAVIVGDPMCGNGNHQYRERAARGRNDCRGRHLQLRTESRLPRAFGHRETKFLRVSKRTSSIFPLVLKPLSSSLLTMTIPER